MSPDIVVAVLGAGGLSAIIGAAVTGMFSKKKLGAEATEIITKAAASVVTNMQADLDRQMARNRTMVDEHRTQMADLCAAHAQEMAEVRRVLQLHVAWDAIAIAKMSEIGVTLPPAPPLLPPTKVDHPSY